MIVVRVFLWLIRVLRAYLLASLVTLFPAPAVTSTPTSWSASPDFDIDPSTGYIPSSPLICLPTPFDAWEDLLEQAQSFLHLGDGVDAELIGGGREGDLWRSRVQGLPVLDPSKLLDLRQLQRAHMVLAFLVHFYAHSTPVAKRTGPVIIPRSLSIPLVIVSGKMGIAPILTFADTVLWNCERTDVSVPLSLHNVRPRVTFSGTDDERAFYMASARTELLCARILHIIQEYNKLDHTPSIDTITQCAGYLAQLETITEELTEYLAHIRDEVDPHVFYATIRPWFVGSDPKSGLEHSWVYEGVPSDGLELDGPSTGQSTALQSLDVFLGVDQQMEGSSGLHRGPRSDQGFMQRMRKYMPRSHRDFLEELATGDGRIRDLVKRTPALHDRYNSLVKALTRLRDMHMRIATLYVVTMERSHRHTGARCPFSNMSSRVNSEDTGKTSVRGTGGNELSALLKAARDATKRTMINSI
ncbi:Indoleamine 2,3-dioxygenase [Punctularia strigosozonata HHB-11173 SS5]|uniref:Indoleamine 2,3-dioxygenase n=1 Tax=Punctularia strigosozonata (strain HHB-11173) TaxID=741275 RepID=UPI000441757A|nr:Indoleamine 2,3-dioxygenase [Punctularia strigosozonata HHB-11173 SS5]EIN07092.1 Indoleamine 2,3-dioxygenase [Punctularia strigosozonata HHB-11173 SS5]